MYTERPTYVTLQVTTLFNLIIMPPPPFFIISPQFTNILVFLASAQLQDEIPKLWLFHVFFFADMVSMMLSITVKHAEHNSNPFCLKCEQRNLFSNNTQIDYLYIKQQESNISNVQE